MREIAISAVITRAALMVVSCMIVDGCHGTVSNRPTPQGAARITIPRIDGNTLAVHVYSSRSKDRLVEHPAPKEERDGIDAFSLSPGTHVLEIDCNRPNAVAVLHGGIDFEVRVEADATYALDCDPKPDSQYGDYDNHFSLTRVEPQEEVKQPPLEAGPWRGCYDIGVGKQGSPMPVGTVWLSGQLRPATAGMYEAVVVKSPIHMTMASWWPVSPTSFHLDVSDGYTGWSGDLEQTPDGLQGAAEWFTDTRQKNGGWMLHAFRASCDP